MLFAALGILVGGIDDLTIDLLFFARAGWRRLTVYSRFTPMTTRTLPLAERGGGLAVFIPAWREADVIGRMLRTTLKRWGAGGDFRLFVGTYPNDPPTAHVVANVAAGDDRVILAINPRPGPTTKADCLNTLWRAMLAEEAARGASFKAVVLHDAEDVVHPDSLRLLDRMADRFDLVQLPVLPLLSQQSLWIAGHYCDEFAESHQKSMAVREAVGAALPSAGVGCAFSRSALAALAARQDGQPFDPGSLTEDYEVGLRIVEMGGRTAFVRMKDSHGGLVCTREHFPETLDAAVRQKARWMVGIALAGWDRLGWHGGLAERWMRLRDRRSAMAAIVLFAAYVALLLWGLSRVLDLAGIHAQPRLTPFLNALVWINAFLMLWRLLMRALFVGRAYGWREAALSVPRTVMANLIAILSARRAIFLYVRVLRGGPQLWEKTQHRFPSQQALEGGR